MQNCKLVVNSGEFLKQFVRFINWICVATNKTKTELVEMGYDKDLVDGLPTGDTDFFTEDKFVRHQNIDFSHGASEGDKSTNDD